MQIKITTDIIPLQLEWILSKSQKITNGEDWRNRNSLTQSAGIYISTVMMENSIVFSQKIIGRSITWSSTSTIGFTSKGHGIITSKINPHVYCSTVRRGQDLELTEVYTNGWMSQENAMRMYHGILLSRKNTADLLLVSTRMEVWDIMWRD